MSGRSIVLVTVDSLRADHCGFMGYERDTTPALDRLADGGFVFENAIAPSTKTPASLPAMMTGQFPVDPEGTPGMAAARDRIGSHMAARDTLAERLSRRGYATAAFTPNPWTSRHFGFAAGFDHFVDFLDRDQASPLFERILADRGSRWINGLRLLSSWAQRENTFKPWESFYDEALAWARRQNEPYFLWLFLLDPHFPYLPDRANRSQSLWATYHANLQLYVRDQDTPYGQKTHDRLVRAYDDAIRYTDGVFERLASDLGEEATVVVTADHGEGFGEHGTYGHHHQLYEENVHVPLVIADDSWQGASERPVSLRRLPDIVTSVASGDAMTYERDDGVVSISPDESLAGLRTRGWKYCQNASDDSAALFDLSSDPAERDNVADERDGATAFGDRLAAIRRHERLRTTLMETVEETVNEVGDRL